MKAQRQPLAADAPARKVEAVVSEAISASLDYYRAVRDATSEAQFFQIYGNVFSLYLADKHEAEASAAESMVEPRDLPFVKEALASIEEGGYAEALARVGALLARRGAPLPLARLALKKELAGEYRDLLPDLKPDQWRRIRGEQDIIVRYEPEQAIATLPILLRDPADRERLITLVRRLLADERMQQVRAVVRAACDDREPRRDAARGAETRVAARCRLQSARGSRRRDRAAKHRRISA